MGKWGRRSSAFLCGCRPIAAWNAYFGGRRRRRIKSLADKSVAELGRGSLDHASSNNAVNAQSKTQGQSTSGVSNSR